MIDPKAKKILFDTYWRSGWKNVSDQQTDVAHFAYAKEKGLMFDPVTITHDECIHEILQISSELDASAVGKGFLSSLSTRRPDWRSALASYHFAHQMKKHPYTSVVSGQSFDMKGNVAQESHTCEVCRDLQYGVIGDEIYEKADVNILNFERIKWGGVRHGELLYTLFDLQRFVDEEIPVPTEKDINIFQSMIQTIATSAQDEYPSALVKRLKDVVKGTHSELENLIEMLAAVSVLKARRTDRPERGKHDWTFVTYWRGGDGFNQEAVDTYFGDYL
jgi:hypothetical protein